jgi:hypothetical protein
MKNRELTRYEKILIRRAKVSSLILIGMGTLVLTTALIAAFLALI